MEQSVPVPTLSRVMPWPWLIYKDSQVRGIKIPENLPSTKSQPCQTTVITFSATKRGPISFIQMPSALECIESYAKYNRQLSNASPCTRSILLSASYHLCPMPEAVYSPSPTPMSNEHLTFTELCKLQLRTQVTSYRMEIFKRPVHRYCAEPLHLSVSPPHQKLHHPM
jgi:hypothetical protein